MIYSITEIDEKADKLNKELVVLSMPVNRSFDGRVDYIKKGKDQYIAKQLYTNDYQLIFNRTDRRKTVTVDGKQHKATIFEFEKVEPKRVSNRTR